MRPVVGPLNVPTELPSRDKNYKIYWTFRGPILDLAVP